MSSAFVFGAIACVTCNNGRVSNQDDLKLLIWSIDADEIVEEMLLVEIFDGGFLEGEGPLTPLEGALILGRLDALFEP